MEFEPIGSREFRIKKAEREKMEKTERVRS